jgi:uncharacterized protein YggU (UPF0235/DUF167 family)
MIAVSAHELGTILPVRAQPGARRNAVLGERAGALRVAVSAPPEKGRANAAIQVVLAAALGCKTSQIDLVAGASARDKMFLVCGISPDELRRRLAAVLSPELCDRTE